MRPWGAAGSLRGAVPRAMGSADVDVSGEALGTRAEARALQGTRLGYNAGLRLVLLEDWCRHFLFWRACEGQESRK